MHWAPRLQLSPGTAFVCHRVLSGFAYKEQKQTRGPMWSSPGLSAEQTWVTRTPLTREDASPLRV